MAVVEQQRLANGRGVAVVIAGHVAQSMVPENDIPALPKTVNRVRVLLHFGYLLQIIFGVYDPLVRWHMWIKRDTSLVVLHGK